MAVVLYNPNPLPFLQIFQKGERIFELGDNLPPIKISQNWGELGVAAVVWEAALVLGTFLLTLKQEIDQKKVLELGSGTGFSGIIASLLGGDVTLTDLPGCLDVCRNNVGLNLDPNINKYSVVPLKWNENLKKDWSDKHFDYIIGADLVYIEDTFQDLVDTLSFFSRTNNPKIYLSGKIRYEKRFKQFKDILEKDFKLNYLKFDNTTNNYLIELKKIK